ncbi:Mu transposase C-terminal domain-containing protein [Paenibacillus sp. MBLB2552]|uniref:Mu transposase C-terminal domain-containing protein n=1 Tax=Paenibacillus mellifer TaxID=2937794 RepID=A0A9X1XYF7_9BACL|nr:Mu transposase C-terminal domain-containing protein [Paenibacillus mellifer]MCK8488275.1 Mu transposase C-terminal domain-containing protein [Paenibacillus mellifer]
MLPANLVNLFTRKGISPETRRIIETIRSSEPSRRVNSGRGNTPGNYPSKKMGVTIQFESHRVEFAGIYEKEHDLNVYEFYDQPPPFTIRYQVNGKNSGRMYHPDFFEIGEDFIGWEEWKTEEELIKLSQEKPYLYVRADDGTWYMPPAEEYAKKLGLSFRVRSSKDINWVYLNNIRFLEDYLLSDSLVVDENAKKILLNSVMEQPGISLKELLDDQNGFVSDDIYKLIVSDDLYFDLNRVRITQIDRARIFPDKEMAQAYSFLDEDVGAGSIPITKVEVCPGNTIQWDGRAHIILNDGETSISLLAQEGQKQIDLPRESFMTLVQKGKIKGLSISQTKKKQEVIEKLKSASKEDLAAANDRYQKIKPILDGYRIPYGDVPERTLRYWVSKYKNAEHLFGYGYVGLLRDGKPGNYVRRFSKELIELMNTFIEDKYETVVNRNASTVWKMLVTECEERGYHAPSLTSFLKEIKKRLQYDITLKREGRKVAYALEPNYLELFLTTPRHGDYPFEICHLDHTQLDIELKCSKTQKNLGKPWVTFLVDAFTRRILAIYLTFDEPGYRSNMMVLRECVRRHSRLPKHIVVDGGKEFGSTYFETLLALYNVGKSLRKGKPKHGSVIERLFGTNNTMFIDNLLGNTQLMKNVRQVTAAVNPKYKAVWTFGRFLDRLKEFAYEVYDTIEHPALGRTPRDEFLNGIAISGERTSTYVAYDEVFYMLTLPTTKKGTAKLDPSKGIKINHIYYWSESLLDPEFAGRQVPVRYDPFNMGVAYAYIRNTWIYMNSEYYSVFVDRTEKEVQQALEELKRRMRLRGEEVYISASKLANFLKSVEAEEALLLQRLRDSEMRSSFTVIEGGKASESINNYAAIKNKESKTKPLAVVSDKKAGSKDTDSSSFNATLRDQGSKYKIFGEF